jgi:hypothetical protein
MSLKIAAMAIGLGAFGSLPASAAVVPAPAGIAKSSVVVSTSALGTLGAAGENLASSPVEQVRRYGGRYYRGHYYRRGYRGHWIGPAIVLGTAAIIIGGSIAESQARYRDRWEMCAERYVSFSWADGTFQPFDGPRRLCPYLAY